MRSDGKMAYLGVTDAVAVCFLCCFCSRFPRLILIAFAFYRVIHRRLQEGRYLIYILFVSGP